jgi:endonuclease YncB( thermonuclease family)
MMATTCTLVDDTGNEHRFRPAGIDTPERRSPKWPKQPYSEEARQYAVALVKGKVVVVEWYKMDRDRKVGVVMVDGADVGLEMLRAGMAWHAKNYAHEQSLEDRAAYSMAEQAARAAGLGLWADHDAKAPWEWRHPTDCACCLPPTYAVRYTVCASPLCSSMLGCIPIRAQSWD